MPISAGLGSLFATLLTSALLHRHHIRKDNLKWNKKEKAVSCIKKKKYGLQRTGFLKEKKQPGRLLLWRLLSTASAFQMWQCPFVSTPVRVYNLLPGTVNPLLFSSKFLTDTIVSSNCTQGGWKNRDYSQVHQIQFQGPLRHTKLYQGTFNRHNRFNPERWKSAAPTDKQC